MEKNGAKLRASVKALKALADQRRLRAAVLLAAAGRELCVCELVDAMGESQYNVSRCLGALCSAGLALKERRGRWAMYSLAPGLGELGAYIRSLAGASGGRCAVPSDAVRLKARLALRRRGVCVVGCNC